MLWGLTSETWSQLWSGAIGSFVAAVVGGLVALAVVKLTNGHQTVLADRAAERLAMGEMVSTFDAMLLNFREGREEIQPLVDKAVAAATLWELVVRRPSFSAEIREWPYFMGRLALQCMWEDVLQSGDDAAYVRMQEATSAVRSVAMMWITADLKRKKKLEIELRLRRTAIWEQTPAVPEHVQL